MSNDLVSQQLTIPGNQMAQLEPISSKLEAPMSMGLMGFGTSGSLQQQIPSSMPIGQMGSVSNDLRSQLSSMSKQKPGQIESQTYSQLSRQYLMPNKPVGETSPTMLDTLRPHQLPTLSKRKAPMEPISTDSVPQKLPVPNKRVAQMEHRPWLQPISAPSKRTVQMQSVSNTPGSQPSPASIKRSVPNKTGSSASRNQPGQMRSSPKVQTESFESVRSKMRESLAAALALVSQQQGENSKVEKNSNGEAASSPGKTQESTNPVDSNSGNADAVGSMSAEPQGILLSSQDGAGGGNISDTTKTLKCDGQQFQSSNLLPNEDVPFSDNIFARDELLQGNGLSWVLEPVIDVAENKEIETFGKQNPVNEKIGEIAAEKSVQSPQVLAYQIEAELFKLFGGVNKKYKEKGRSLLFNLKDRNNPELRERVVSGEISPERLCSMSAEDLASKELSQWRQAKAEELAQMVVLPDTEVDIRRLVKKTHKGEFQVEVEQTDSASVEVSAATSISRRPKTEAKQGPTTGKTVGKKNGSGTAGEKSNIEDPDLTITIPSSEGPDPMQGLMGEDELKDADFLPPIVSLDEFMQSLDSEPPFENLPSDARKATSICDKDDSEAGSDSKSSGRASQDPVDTMPDKLETIDASNVKSDADVKPNDIPAKTGTTVSVATLKGEHVWEGLLQLNITAMTSVIGTFKSGEKTCTKEWPSLLEIKGRVRLDAFEKFLQELPMSRSRAVMVVHFVCKEGSADSERGSLVEAADSYILDGRVGFAEPASGVELYFCPPHAKTHEMLSKILPKDQLEALNAIDNGLIGVVVWRRAQLISPNSTSHHKHTSKKQHLTSRRQQEKDANMNTNFPSKPTLSHGGPPIYSKPSLDDNDDDDVPPGFGPATTRDEDDLPEFNFSGGSNPSGPQYPTGYQSQRVGIVSAHSHSQTSSRPVDQMRELVQKYGQPNTNASLGVSMQPWNDDDDDIPEWQPQISQQQQLQQPTQVHRFQQPMHVPQQLPHQTLSTMHVQGQQNTTQSWQQGTWWVPTSGSQGQQFVNGAQFYGAAVGTGQPAWRKDPPHSRGF
ncbi:death-inducer obliterator 1-like [Herrania umbratica]|uniref:Death-inducer obliterator 1-like n=1 Tax=Herrania umbratica TaxID=108875 RepID=A0A6J0ZS01_9ROSI|nr:death-inducer obliterator 1-like [Herrania umbratica]